MYMHTKRERTNKHLLECFVGRMMPEAVSICLRLSSLVRLIRSSSVFGAVCPCSLCLFGDGFLFAFVNVFWLLTLQDKYNEQSGFLFRDNYVPWLKRARSNMHYGNSSFKAHWNATPFVFSLSSPVNNANVWQKETKTVPERVLIQQNFSWNQS